MHCKGVSFSSRGLQNEVLCTKNPTTATSSCRALYSYSSAELTAIEEQGIPNWTEYNYFPDFVTFWMALWACYLLAEQQTLALMMVVKSSFTAMLASISCSLVYLVLGSATVKYESEVMALNRVGESQIYNFQILW